MRSTSRGSKKYPEKYDDPLGLDDVYEPAPLPEDQGVVTGLSDEEDARRHLARKFNTQLAFCRNCEVHYDMPYQIDAVMWTQQAPDCPRCMMMLEPVGTPALSTRRKHTK